MEKLQMVSTVSAAALTRFWRGEDAQDLIEYALLVGLIALAAVASVTQIGTVIRTVFWDVIAAAIPRV
jgi:Flp pilus assembly pilin Flp